MAELKNCPFCGYGGVSLEWNGDVCRIRCKSCGTQGAWKDCRDKAIEAWNSRATDEETAFTRKFLHDNGLEFALASAWQKRHTQKQQ